MARPRSDIQPRIVAAARARFLSAGVDGASLREIAKDAKTNIGMVVYYFPSKDDLFLAVVEETYAPFLAEIAGALAGDAPLRERLERTFVRLGNASEREIEVVRLVAREALLSSKRFRRILGRFMRGHLSLLLRTVAEGAQSGELDASIPMPILLMCVLGMGGLPQLARRVFTGVAPFGPVPPVEDVADLSVRMIFKAVGGQPSTRAKKARSRVAGAKRAAAGGASRPRRRA